MPGPFPGMDPYLEHPGVWPGVHPAFITYMRPALNAMLLPRYVAEMGERLYVVQSERSIYPDLLVRRPTTARPPEQARSTSSVALGTDPSWRVMIHPVEVREVFLEIRSLPLPGRLVAVFEVLSPANKTSGSEGRELYLRKQREVLASATHLIEIDLLRYGEHTVAPPRDKLLELGTWDYLISLRDSRERELYEVWPVAMRQRLPRVRVPLAGDDPDLVLDLQPILDRCYADGGYDQWLDYRDDPYVSLKAEDSAWASALLRERGLRE
jgi:Protein of unknown function (DUF4058)